MNKNTEFVILGNSVDQLLRFLGQASVGGVYFKLSVVGVYFRLTLIWVYIWVISPGVEKDS